MIDTDSYSENYSRDLQGENNSGDLQGVHAENEVLPVRKSVEIMSQKKSSVLTLSQKFTDSSQSYVNCVCLVVSLDEVLKALSCKDP